ncbi:MAG: heavy-metal-associated domain-containing protein [Sphingobacteriales bacterium]|jgi:mercuric ion binding protein|nr:heavy-metal-associated domain-containing protein [Sphingobacteriales bacterium]
MQTFLVYLRLWALVVLLGAAVSCSGSKTAQQGEKAKPDWQTCQIQTSAQCDMCATRIEGALVKVKGVKDAELNLQNRIAEVRYDAHRTSPDALRQAIAAVGYDADKIAANPEAYGKLPACCKKGGHD